MSTPWIDASLIDQNTIAQTTHAILPPDQDPRTRRYGYNPGVRVMEVHPRDSGRQQSLIPAGVLVKFETTPMKGPNWSVDPQEQKPREVWIEGGLLALDAVRNVQMNYTGEPDMGFRVLDPLTALTDRQSAIIFSTVHPSFIGLRRNASTATNNPASEMQAALGQGYDPCPYDLPVCVSCRLAVLKQLDSYAIAELVQQVDRQERIDIGAAQAVRDIIADGVAALERYYRSEFRGWVGEIDGRSKGSNRGLQSLSMGHVHIMEQLHELDPEHRQERLTASFAEAQATAMREAMQVQGEAIANALAGNRSTEVNALRQELAEMKQQFEQLLQRAQQPPPEPPTETGKKSR